LAFDHQGVSLAAQPNKPLTDIDQVNVPTTMQETPMNSSHIPLSSESSFSKGSTLTTAFCVFGMLLLTACDAKQDPQQTTTQAPTSAGTQKPVTEPADTGNGATGEDAINEVEYRRHIEILASDEFGGRAPASPGEQLTVDYLTQAFTGLGLEPANGDSYIQDVPLASVTVSNSPELVFSGGEGEDLTLAYTKDQVVWSRRQVTDAAIKDSELVFVGYGITAPERGWDDYAGLNVTGKTVVILVNDPGFATQDPELFNGNAMTYYGRWTYKFDQAARHGAAGAIIIHDTQPAAYGWSTVINSWTGPQFAMVLPDKGKRLASVEGWITKDNASALFAKAGMDLEEMYAKAQQPGFKGVNMGLKATATLVSEAENVNSRNVAAILKGSEAPDEYFIYMAHWDHLGTDPTIEGDNIFNGALDNATGTAALLEIARAYATLPQAPRRSVMFLAVTAEEQGLLGSLYYAANPLVPLADTVAGLNMDGMNNFGETRDITVTGLGMSELDKYLTKAAAMQEKVLVADREAEKGYYYRSDHFELAQKGVPMLYPGSGYDHKEKGVEYGMQKSEEYVAKNYHRVSDEYDLSWDVSGAMADMKMFFRTGLSIANSNDWPNWNEGTEFKATRDKQLRGSEE
jgi:Zn-dependent M28 family amino/carboxypeptidase